MEYPHGHHHHRRQDDRRQEDVEEYPPPAPFHDGYDAPPPPFYGGAHPPPPFYGGPEPPRQFHNEIGYPPPQSYHASHIGPDRESYPHPPPPLYGGHEPPSEFYNGEIDRPPPRSYHESHVGLDPESYPHPPPPQFPSYSSRPLVSAEEAHHHFHMPQFPPEIGHHGQGRSNELANKPSVKMYCKAETNYSLAIRDGKVILAPSDPSDPSQHWIKDLKFSTKVKDAEGFPSFALVNKATGLAMKHSIGATHPVQLIPYNPNVLDESVLWAESRDTGDGYRAIRMVNNIRLNVDAFNGDKDHGGVHDGTTIVLWEWAKGDNQRWKIVPYCKFVSKKSTTDKTSYKSLTSHLAFGYPGPERGYISAMNPLLICSLFCC